MADLGVLDVLVIGGGMGGCIVATRLAEHGVHPETGEPLRIAILERGPYFKGDRDPRPGYGVPFRRKLFTSVAQDSRENTRYTMASGFTQDEVDRGISQRHVNTRRGDASAIGGDHSTGIAIPKCLLTWTMALTPKRQASTGPLKSCAPQARKSRGCLIFTVVLSPFSTLATFCFGILQRLLDTV